METNLWIGTRNGLYRLTSDDREQLAEDAVQALTPAKDGWWAILGRHTIWRFNRKGEGEQVASLKALRLTCLLPAARGLLVGAAEAGLYRLTDGTLERVTSFDAAPGRDTWFTPWGGPPDVRSMTSSAAGELYINVHVGGVLRSDEQGGSWTPTLEIHADVHQVLCDQRSGTLLAPSARGLGMSQDGGQSWSFETDGLHATYMRAVAVAGETILASTSTGPSAGARAALYRRPLKGAEPFERCEQGLPEWFHGNIDTHCLEAAGAHAVFGTDEGALYESRDSGRSWTQLTADLPPIRCLTLA